jgi:hypothetical protein
MEDRHNLSEPRPILGLELPTWDVDILREGVDVPILTVRVDERALPPRKRKKKVVWKLPDTVDQIPKFGKEDKLRILEIFKQQKKTLKREKRKSPEQQQQQPQQQDQPKDGPEEKTPLPDTRDTTTSTRSASSGSDGSGGGCLLLNNEKQKLPARKGGAGSWKKGQSLGPPGFGSLSLEEKKQSEAIRASTNTCSLPSGAAFHSPPAPPPGLSSVDRLSAAPVTPLSPSHPPGLHPMSPGIRQSPSSSNNNTTPPPPPGMHPMQNRATSAPSSSPTTTNTASPPSQEATQQHNLPTRRYFQLSPPSANGNSAVMMNLAQIVTQSYYYMLTHGHVQELRAHYAPAAAKSLTVGGAHAICHTLQDIELQLQSLVGTVVAIRGVLQQSIPSNPAAAAAAGGGSNMRMDSILLVITGMCVRPNALPFCHSLVLTPTTNSNTNTVGYQIQNDALCFLTTEVEGTAAGGPANGPPNGSGAGM